MKIIVIMYVVLNTGPAPITTVEMPGRYATCAEGVVQSKATYIPGEYGGSPKATEVRLGFLCIPAEKAEK